MTEVPDKGERYYQGKHGAPVPWMKPQEKRPDPPKPERQALNTRLRRAIRIGIVSTADVWRSSFVEETPKKKKDI